MKLHFEANLDYQQAAIGSVVDLFRGQEICRTEFTVTAQSAVPLLEAAGVAENVLGIGNRLHLLDDQIQSNLHAIQLRNGLSPSSSLASGDFTVEMETGTGKTYVYLRTVFELNRQYGFTKFVIVVPSVAIKEGVYKTLEITQEHFRSLYAGVPFEFFLYDSSKPGQVRNFATSPNIQIMVVTVGAINKKDVNNLYKDTEKLSGERPIDLLVETRPIVIVDEPQTVTGGAQGQGEVALAAMKPLCTLRYSATHVQQHHMVYRLDAVDAYEQKLVKQIEVASLQVEGGHNSSYIKLLSTSNKNGAISAKLELDVQQGKTVSRQAVTVEQGDDLQDASNGRALYADWRVQNISCRAGDEHIELSRREQPLRVGEAVGGVDEDQINRHMIRRTIREHLDKELRLRPQGIKVLSLFFIDAVANYRVYDDNGQAQKGKFAKMFEEEYRSAAKDSRYHDLFKGVDFSADASQVHDGYFSIDKNGRASDTAENNEAGRQNAERAYNLIMKEKEKLLSMDTKLKFIFSHSALREGWDNPNVFQICVLRDVGTELRRRQIIGRGLRLCVNQDGLRVRGFDVNTLTVVARESYEDFAKTLQHEIESDTGIRFGIVEKHQFANIPIPGVNGTTETLGVKQSEAVWYHLRDRDLIDAKGKVQDALRTALKDGTLDLPAAVADQAPAIKELLRKLAGRLDVKNADDRKTVRTRRANLDSAEFAALWDRIEHKTTYRVEFDNEKLVADCADAIYEGPPITRTRVNIRKADLAIGRGGVTATAAKNSDESLVIKEDDIELPDLLTDLQDKTQLTRRSLVRILTNCRRLQDFKRNPQEFIENAVEAIARTK
ncbi:MAG: DEAD/DEAH box helicase family protein, partial [Rhodoferax sp.]